jgi:putative oxidoreductase
MTPLVAWLDGQRANSLLVCRAALAAVLIVAGYNKLFNLGIPTVIGNFDRIGLFAAPVLGVLVPLLEFFGGLAILAGLFSRLLAVWVLVQFFIITVYVKPVLQGEGWGPTRLDLLLACLGFLIAAHGSGPLSLAGRLFRGKRWAE